LGSLSNTILVNPLISYLETLSIIHWSRLMRTDNLYIRFSAYLYLLLLIILARVIPSSSSRSIDSSSVARSIWKKVSYVDSASGGAIPAQNFSTSRWISCSSLSVLKALLTSFLNASLNTLSSSLARSSSINFLNLLTTSYISNLQKKQKQLIKIDQ